MEVISIQQKYDEPVVLCLGFFDCMHKGHLRLLETAKSLAAKRGARLALFTFCNNHFEMLNRPIKLLYTFDERLKLYEKCGVDVVVFSRFDAEFMAQKGAEFLQLLSRNFDLQGVVCGRDFTCGSDLLSANKVHAFYRRTCPVKIVSLVKTARLTKVSSTFIRQLLSDCDVRRANSYLSEPFYFIGTVLHGRNVGHTLGVPTANLQIPLGKIAPLGVYCGVAEVDGAKYKAVVNVGIAPTFNEKTPRVEAHLINFNGDLYGKTVKVSLLKYLREIHEFASEQALQKQLKKDIASCKQGGGK